MIAEKALPLSRSLQSALHQELLDPSVSSLSSIASTKYELFATSFQHLPFVFISLQTLCAKPRRCGTSQRPEWALSYSADSIYHHLQVLGLSSMFSVQYELFAHFCNADPLFSILYELFAQKTPGVGYTHKNPRTQSRAIQFSSSVPESAGFTVAPRPPEIPCAGTAASERRLCGRATGWNSRLRCWPHQHGASSSPQMPLPPARSRH
jgi:hypothetical protein